jgi:ABC-type molybdate transport system substrate-binding protein
VKSKGLILLFFAAAAAAVVYTVLRKPAPPGGAPAPGGTAAGGPGAGGAPAGGPPPGPRVAITVAFGTEKEAWMQAAITEFRAAHPQYDIELVAKGSFESAQEILDGKLRPTVWSPADSLELALLDADWKTKTGTALFAHDGELAPEPLLLSPLVFVVWEDRAGALLKAGKGTLTWKAIRKAVASNKGWPAIGGKPDWGFVKLGHTDPTKSNSGLQALWSMTLEYFGRGAPIGVEQLLRPDYQAFVSAIEHGVTRFEPSTGTFMIDMVRFGPSKYDMAVVYESLAIAQIANAQGRWGNLRVYYPQLTAWSDHPIAIPQAPWVTAPQRAAARELLAHLHGRSMQARALAFGFRPADPEVPIKTADADNPFIKLAPFGVKTELAPASAPPEAAVVRNLMMLWTRLMAGAPGH